MKIYKYRDLTDSDGIAYKEKLERLFQIIIDNQLWCASPDLLNDKDDEFRFRCNCTPSASTKMLLTQSLQKQRNLPSLMAKWGTADTIDKNKLVDIATPILGEISIDCRNTLGIISFSYKRDDSLLWERYGGNGNGACIELDIPDELLNVKLFNVDYVSEKVFHIDTLLKADLFPNKRFEAYIAMLATKTADKWMPENEVRCLTKKQSIPDIPNPITLDIEKDLKGAITEIMFGRLIPPQTIEEIKPRLKKHRPNHNIALTESACD